MKSIVSLEISTDRIRAAEIAKPHSSKPVLIKYHEIRVSPGVVGDSEVFDAEVAADALKKLWAEAEFSTKVVNLGVSSRRIMVRDYEAPYIDLAKIKETLTFEAADLLPSQMENSVLDFYPIEKVERNGKSMVAGLLVATAAEPLEDIMRTLTMANLTIEYVDLTPFGLARVARSLLPMNEEYFIVNINAFSSEVVAVRNGSPHMVRVVPNGIPFRSSDSGKHVGVADSNQSMNLGSPANSSGATNVDSFIGALRATLNHYEGKGGNVQKLYFSGEGSLSEELQEKIPVTLGLPARTLDLESVIGPPTKQEFRDKVTEAALVSTVAVALRGMK